MNRGKNIDALNRCKAADQWTFLVPDATSRRRIKQTFHICHTYLGSDIVIRCPKFGLNSACGHLKHSWWTKEIVWRVKWQFHLPSKLSTRSTVTPFLSFPTDIFRLRFVTAGLRTCLYRSGFILYFVAKFKNVTKGTRLLASTLNRIMHAFGNHPVLQKGTDRISPLRFPFTYLMQITHEMHRSC